MREKKLDEEPLFTRLRAVAMENGVNQDVAEKLSRVGVNWHMKAKGRALKMKHDRLTILAKRYKCKNASCKMPKLIHDEFANEGGIKGS